MSRPTQLDGRVHGVVVGITREDGKLLLIRRSRTVAAPRKVCFPGGAIERGESQFAACIREMREEIGVEVQPLKCLWKWVSPQGPLTLWGWRARIIAGELRPDPAEVEEILWATPDEACGHPDAMPNNPDFVLCLGGEPNSVPPRDDEPRSR